MSFEIRDDPQQLAKMIDVLLKELSSVVELAEFAMRDANRDFCEYDIEGELMSARKLLAKLNK